MTASLTGVQKAAILLCQITDKEKVAKVYRCMRESEVAEISAEIVRLGSLSRSQVESVYEEFLTIASAREEVVQGGVARARDLLVAAHGEEKADEILSKLDAVMAETPFAFLDRTDPKQVLNVLREENPQTIAVVLAHVRSDMAATILDGLSEDVQQSVAKRLVVLDRVAPEVIGHIEANLGRRLSGVLQAQGGEQKAGGVTALADILNAVDKSTERAVFEGLRAFDEDVADKVQSQLFTFEDIATLDARSVQAILGAVPDNLQIAKALRGAPESVAAMLLANVSENRRATIDDEVRTMKPLRRTEVEEARAAVVRVARSLEEEGKVFLSSNAADALI